MSTASKLKIAVLVLLFFVTAFPLGSQANSLNAGLIIYYPFDHQDQFGAMTWEVQELSKNSATLGNAPTLVKGQMGQAYSFNGTNQYVVTPSFVPGTSIMTVAFWYYTKQWGHGDELTLESSTNSNNTTGGFLINLNPSVALTTTSLTVDIRGSTSSYYIASCYTRPSVNAWHQYTFILDNSTALGSTTLYIDGNPASFVGYSKYDKQASGNFPTQPIYMMSRAGSSLFASSTLDDVRIYSRALSQNEAALLYQQGFATSGK